MQQFVTGGIRVRPLVLILTEHVLIISAVAIAAVIRRQLSTYPDALDGGFIARAAFIAAVLQVCLHYCDLYDLRTLHDRRALAVNLVQAVGAASVVLALLYYWIPTLIVGRGVFVLASGLIVALVAGWRLLFEWLSLKVAPSERLLIVGTNAAAVALARELYERRGQLGIHLVGFVDADPSSIGTSLINPGIIGSVAQIPDIVKEQRVDRVVVSLADARGKLSMDELLDMRLNKGVRFDHLASVYERCTGKIAVENLRPSWLIFSDGFRKSRIHRAAKRWLDLALAIIGLLVAGPVMAMVAVAVRLASPGPALYSQRRVGQDGRIFTIHKFRSMSVNAEANTGPVWAQAGRDPRVTPIGRFLRRTRLDELPQLWNVLRGDMSVVGPRPERPEFVTDLATQIPFYGQRHVVRPGLTGWAQVRHRYGASVGDSLEKLQYDLFYIKHASIAFDLVIILETIKTVLVRRGS